MPDGDEHPSEESGVIVRVVRQDAPPLSISELTCKVVVGVEPDDWHALLRKWCVTYRRTGKLHVALRVDVEAAIRAGATTSKPGPKPRRKVAPPAPDDHRALLANAGFERQS